MRVLSILAIVFFVCAAPCPAVQDVQTSFAQTVQEWGIQPVSWRVDVRGRTSELRYRVLDPEKALYILDKVERPIVIRLDEGRQYQSVLPARVGNIDLLKSNPDPERVYFLRIFHPSFPLKKGETVGLKLGDMHIDGLRVEPMN